MNDNDKRSARDFTSIPASACCLVIGEPEFGDNGEGAKSAPVRLTARSGKPIEHWYWGRIVHDLAGMHLHKPRLPIDYVHDSKEVIGYLNKFETDSGDLVTSGALVPFKDSDRATEILHKFRQGVPYEASINFGGDGLKVQEVGENEVAQVNGYQFEGPGVIVREWPLRGVAICPYGADMNTSSAEFSAGKTFRAAVVAEPDANTKEHAMSEQPVEVEADAVEQPVAENETVESTELQSVEEAQEEAQPVEGEQPVEAAAVESEVATEGDGVAELEAAQPEQEAKPEPISREEFCKIADEFGAEIAAKTVADGGNYETALRAAYDALRAEVRELREAISETTSTGQPVKAMHAEKTTGKLFNTGK